MIGSMCHPADQQSQWQQQCGLILRTSDSKWWDPKPQSDSTQHRSRMLRSFDSSIWAQPECISWTYAPSGLLYYGHRKTEFELVHLLTRWRSDCWLISHTKQFGFPGCLESEWLSSHRSGRRFMHDSSSGTAGNQKWRPPYSFQVACTDLESLSRKDSPCWAHTNPGCYCWRYWAINPIKPFHFTPSDWKSGTRCLWYTNNCCRRSSWFLS